MKFLLILFATIGLAYGQFNRAISPQFQPTYRQTGLDKYAKIVKQSSDASPDGSYQYAYETENGIAVQESGTPKRIPGIPPQIAESVQGGYAYTSPEGKVISISYIADENGFRAAGDAIPTPPPIPDYILRSIAYIKAKSAQTPPRRFF